MGIFHGRTVENKGKLILIVSVYTSISYLFSFKHTVFNSYYSMRDWFEQLVSITEMSSKYIKELSKFADNIDLEKCE